jgi:glycosyltransferase involved in cell wall biosynthesis
MVSNGRIDVNVLALEPYYGGSHRDFLDGWVARSRHRWTLCTLPGSKWKWRMRHSALTFADEVRERVAKGGTWDVIFCSDMLGLAEFRGLAPAAVSDLPAVAYFHENQLTYPKREESERDYHFVFSNMLTAAAATQTWFNSVFHRDEFLSALGAFVRRMPDFRPEGTLESIRAGSAVYPPGIELPPPRTEANGGDRPHILWAARWEYDKDPQTFFQAMELLQAKGVDFGLSVIGGSGGRQPMPVFERCRELFGPRIVHWGYQASRGDYLRCLQEANIAVSTSQHEFFGLSMVEAAAAGAYPLLPRRLAYPEVFAAAEDPDRDSFFYEEDGDAEVLAGRLSELIERHGRGRLWEDAPDRGRDAVAAYAWERAASAMDAALEGVAGQVRLA